MNSQFIQKLHTLLLCARKWSIDIIIHMFSYFSIKYFVPFCIPKTTDSSIYHWARACPSLIWNPMYKGINEAFISSSLILTKLHWNYFGTRIAFGCHTFDFEIHQCVCVYWNALGTYVPFSFHYSVWWGKSGCWRYTYPPLVFGFEYIGGFSVCSLLSNFDLRV